MSEAKEFISKALILSASAVGDTLSDIGLDSEKFGFTLVIWPIGDPARCSSICGSGHPDGQGESTAALAAASDKVKGEPHIVTAHISKRPN